MRQTKLPDPPSSYDQSYFRALVRSIESALQSQFATSRGQFTTVNISQLPTSSTGLATGELWNDAGTIKVKT